MDHASAPDSREQLAVLLGDSKVGRESLIEQGSGPLTLAVRKGQWKMIPHLAAAKKPVPIVLYNVTDDPGETKDVAADHPEIVEELSKVLVEARGK